MRGPDRSSPSGFFFPAGKRQFFLKIRFNRSILREALSKHRLSFPGHIQPS